MAMGVKTIWELCLFQVGPFVSLRGLKWGYLVPGQRETEAERVAMAYLRKEFNSTRLVWDTNIKDVSPFWDTNMAAVRSCENTLWCLHSNHSSTCHLTGQYYLHTNAQLILNEFRSSSWDNRTVCNFPVDLTSNVYKPFIIWFFAQSSQAH